MQKSMSALPPIADICGAPAHVCLVPIADILERQLLHLPQGTGSMTLGTAQSLVTVMLIQINFTWRVPGL